MSKHELRVFNHKGPMDYIHAEIHLYMRTNPSVGGKKLHKATVIAPEALHAHWMSRMLGISTMTPQQYMKSRVKYPTLFLVVGNGEELTKQIVAAARSKQTSIRMLD